MGYDVPVLVPSGEEAIATARQEPPDLVLMDINLEGEMDGVEAADELARRISRGAQGTTWLYLMILASTRRRNG